MPTCSWSAQVMVISCEGNSQNLNYCGYYINGATPGVEGSPRGWSKVAPDGKMAFAPSFTGSSQHTFDLDSGGPGRDAGGGPSATVPSVQGRPDLNSTNWTPVQYGTTLSYPLATTTAPPPLQIPFCRLFVGV